MVGVPVLAVVITRAGNTCCQDQCGSCLAMHLLFFFLLRVHHSMYVCKKKELEACLLSSLSTRLSLPLSLPPSPLSSLTVGVPRSVVHKRVAVDLGVIVRVRVVLCRMVPDCGFI